MFLLLNKFRNHLVSVYIIFGYMIFERGEFSFSRIRIHHRSKVSTEPGTFEYALVVIFTSINPFFYFREIVIAITIEMIEALGNAPASVWSVLHQNRWGQVLKFRNNHFYMAFDFFFQ